MICIARKVCGGNYRVLHAIVCILHVVILSLNWRIQSVYLTCGIIDTLNILKRPQQSRGIVFCYINYVILNGFMHVNLGHTNQSFPYLEIISNFLFLSFYQVFITNFLTSLNFSTKIMFFCLIF